MVYGIYLVLDQDQWYRDDFSSASKLTGTVFTNKSLTKKKDLTGKTVSIRMTRNNRWGDHFDKTATIVSATGGTWSYAVSETEMPTPGIYNVVIVLTESGMRESTLNRAELQVIEGAVQ